MSTCSQEVRTGEIKLEDHGGRCEAGNGTGKPTRGAGSGTGKPRGAGNGTGKPTRGAGSGTGGA